MDSLQLQTLLIEKSETMPKKARRVVEYLLSNMREASFKSISDVASELKVSKAQLVRVAQMLGFSGYAELKQTLQNSILEQINPVAFLTKDTFSESISTVIHKTEYANLDDTMSQLKDDDISKFCQIMKHAKNIYCMGWGISSLVMELFYLRLSVIGCKAVLSQRGSLSLWEQARSIKTGDVVVVCELPSYAVEITEAVEIAKNNGAKIITITDSAAAPVCRHAFLSFFVSANSPTFGSSVVAPIFLVHTLTSELARSMSKIATKAFEEQADFLHDERIFHPIFGLKY